MNKPSTKKTNKNVEKLNITSFRVIRARVLPKSGAVSFDLELNGITIYGCFVREVEGGKDFISLPQRQGADGKYYSVVWARFSDDDTRAIINEVENLLNE